MADPQSDVSQQGRIPTPSLNSPTTPAGDPSQYIRTYAKDVARLTGGQMPPLTPRPEAGVSLPEVDVSPMNRPDGIVKEFPQEVLNVTKEDSAGIFAGAPPLSTSDTQERETVLARLREKIVSAQQAAPPPPPMPPPAPVPPPPGVVPVQRMESEPSPLHTYTSDFADRIDQKQASTFTVLAAQGDAPMVAPAATPKRSGLVPIVLATLLIIFGAGGLFAAYTYLGSREAPQETLGIPSLILADEKMELTGPDYRQALRDAANQPLVEGNILVTYVTVSSSTSLGIRNAPEPGGALIRLLELGAPDILLRNVDITSTVGVVSAGGQTNPFFVMRVSSYERTFAGMLGWENGMLEDLDPLYPLYDTVPEPADALATTTATSTMPIPPLPTGPSPQGFVDAVVANHDVRMLKDRYGRTLILYGYSDRQTLILARDEEAFTTLTARLAATRGQ